MFNFGDGAVAGLVVGERRAERGARRARDHERLVLAPGEGRRGGSVDPDGYRFLDVADPAAMKGGLDEVSLPNFVAAARGRGRALRR